MSSEHIKCETCLEADADRSYNDSQYNPHYLCHICPIPRHLVAGVILIESKGFITRQEQEQGRIKCEWDENCSNDAIGWEYKDLGHTQKRRFCCQACRAIDRLRRSQKQKFIAYTSLRFVANKNQVYNMLVEFHRIQDDCFVPEGEHLTKIRVLGWNLQYPNTNRNYAFKFRVM